MLPATKEYRHLEINNLLLDISRTLGKLEKELMSWNQTWMNSHWEHFDKKIYYAFNEYSKRM